MAMFFATSCYARNGELLGADDHHPIIPGEAAFKARVEQFRRIIQRRTLRECQLHHGFVGLAGADDAALLPYRNAAPFPCLFHIGHGPFDQCAHMGQRLAPPITQLLDPRVNER